MSTGLLQREWVFSLGVEWKFGQSNAKRTFCKKWSVNKEFYTALLLFILMITALLYILLLILLIEILSVNELLWCIIFLSLFWEWDKCGCNDVTEEQKGFIDYVAMDEKLIKTILDARVVRGLFGDGSGRNGGMV